MRRIAIIDHSTHTLYVEDIDEYELINKYSDDEQKYIDEHYAFDGEYSWDWIVDAQYFPEFEKNPVGIYFEDIGDI